MCSIWLAMHDRRRHSCRSPAWMYQFFGMTNMTKHVFELNWYRCGRDFRLANRIIEQIMRFRPVFSMQYGQSSKSKSKWWHESNKALLAVILCMQILLIHTIPKYINYIYIIGLSLLSWHFYSPKFIYAFEPNLMTSLYRDRTAIKQRSFLCWLRTKSSQNDDNNNTSIINI